jgi:dephospho-CoA kinase
VKHPPHFVVGLAGRAGAGKSTVARLIREQFNLPHRQMACEIRKFAGPLRGMLEYVGIEKGDEHGETADPDFRECAQFIGHGLRSIKGQDFWVDIQRHAMSGLSAPTLIIFDDVRYANEAALCDLVIRLVTVRESALTELQRTHPTEAEIASFDADFVLGNDTPADARNAADAVAQVVREMLKGN